VASRTTRGRLERVTAKIKAEKGLDRDIAASGEALSLSLAS
jgi:hypothetical protein